MSEHRIGTREEWGFAWVSTSGNDFPFGFGSRSPGADG